MSDDPTFKMYEAQAELVETKERLEKIQKENDELKNQMAANNLMRIIDDFQRNNYNRFEAMEENLRRLTTDVSNNHDAFADIEETLKDLKETIRIQTENEKRLVADLAKLSETVETIQKAVTTFSTKDKETILLVGGKSGDKVVDSLIILQNNGENDDKWKELNIKLPYGVNGHGAQFLNNHLYIFGGKHEKDEILYSSYKLIRGHKWLNNSLKWEKIMDMNQKRTEISNSNVILNDRIWVIGGWNGIEGSLKSVERYDPETNIWTNMKPTNECRQCAAAAVVNGKIFCCGGYNRFNFLKSAECYDPSSDVWTLISDMPGPNGACGVVVVNAHLIVIGGKAAIYKDFFNSVWVLDTTDKNAKWTEKEPRMSRPLCQFSIAKIHDKIFVCGGLYISRENSTMKYTNDVEIFDGEIWKNGPKLAIPRRNAPAVNIPMEFAQYLN